MRIQTAFALLFLSLLPQAGIPQVNHVHNGFLKGEEFTHMKSERQRAYAAGIIDGMLLAPLFGAPDNGQKIQSFGACIDGMSDTQIVAIIEKFLRDHPERWNENLHTAVFTAMKEACARK